MSRAVLQIPLDPALRIAAEKAALEQGFSSLQDAVRIFLKKLADGVMSVGFHESYRLTPKNEKRYLKMVEGVKAGRVKTLKFDNMEDTMAYLNK